MQLRTLWAQVAQTGGARFYSLLVGLVILAVTARVLGPAGRGVVVAAIAWATLFATVGGLSVGQVAFNRAAGRPPGEWLPETLASLLVILGGVSILVWVAVAITWTVTGGGAFPNIAPAVLALALVAVPALMWTEYASSLLMALDSLRIVNIAQAASSTLNALLVVVLLAATPLGVNAPLIALAAGGLLGAAITLRAIRRRCAALRWDGRVTRELLGGAARLHANAIGTFLFTQASLLIVNHFRSPAETGYFSLALQLVLVMHIFPLAVGMVAYTVVGKLGPNAAWPHQRRLLLQSLGGAALLIVAAYAAAPLMIRIAAGEEFLPAVPLLRVMLPALFGMTFSAVMASQWIGRGFFLLASMTTLAIGCINVAATLLVVTRYDLMAVAWVTAGVYGVAVIGNGLMALWVERHVGRTTTPDIVAAGA